MEQDNTIHKPFDTPLKRKAGNPNLQKGMQSLNPTGRPKGSANRTTKELREFLKDWLDNEGLPTLFERFPNMNDRLVKESVEMVAKFLLPTLSATKLEAEVNTNVPTIVEIVYRKKDNPNPTIEDAEVMED